MSILSQSIMLVGTEDIIQEIQRLEYLIKQSLRVTGGLSYFKHI